MSTNDDMLSVAEANNLVSGSDIPAFSKLHSCLEDLSGDNVDSGIGNDGADFWVTINGIEYFITATRSKKQRKKEQH